MNLTARLVSQDLTTLSRVQTQLNASRSSGNADPLYSQLISDVSRRMTEYLGFHTLQAARVETYEVSIARTMLTLDGMPIDTAQTFEVRLGSTPGDTELDALTAQDATTYRVSAPGGWIRFTNPTWASPTWARVTYTGGLATSTPQVIVTFGDIAYACDLQVKYAVQRMDSLGGNLKTMGGGAASSFTGEYGLLREVREILDVHKRHDL